MGVFYVQCEVFSHLDRSKRVRIPKLLVDTGSECTWISETLLKKIKIAPEKKDLTFIMANGQTITRRVGFAIIRAEGVVTTDEVVFAQEGDLQLLGARTLEGLNLRVDPRSKKLVAGGPLPAAAGHSISSVSDETMSSRQPPLVLWTGARRTGRGMGELLGFADV